MNRTELLQSVAQREFNLLETMKVLKHDISKYFSWGVSKLANFENKVLVMKVNGHHHKGYVFISLAWNDTYTVSIVTTHNNVKKTFTEVYFDMLADTIDKEIEYVKAYS